MKKVPTSGTMLLQNISTANMVQYPEKFKAFSNRMRSA